MKLKIIDLQPRVDDTMLESDDPVVVTVSLKGHVSDLELEKLTEATINFFDMEVVLYE